MKSNQIPHRWDIFNELLQALKELGGEAYRDDVIDKVADILKLTDAQREEKLIKRDSTKFAFEVGWARWGLNKYGLIEFGAKRGFWKLTDKGFATEHVNKADVQKTIKDYIKQNKKIRANNIKSGDDLDSEDDNPEVEQWQIDLLQRIKAIHPYGFELMCKNILTKLGFVDVEVTQASNDGGIDGFATMKVQGVIGFKTAFQCKRYAGSVGVGAIQGFAGATTGQADKTLMITTGSFTYKANLEAERLGIDLIDGDGLVDLMYELRLGLKEEVVLDEDYFAKYDK